MYINFWYPIARSSDVTAEKPLRVQLLMLPFVAFRDEDGQARVLADTCVHRGGSLSAGWVKHGCVVCPYHGWTFSGDGKCVRVPSLGDDSKLPARAKVDSYPVQERYGIVFAFLGDLPESERPPLYDIEEFGTGEWKSQLYVFELAAYYERSIENGLDPIHNEFVHPAQGAPMLSPERQREPVPVEDIPWGSKFYIPFGSKKDLNTALASDRTGERLGAAGSWHQGPNQLVTWIDLTATNSFHQYLFEAPVDEGHTRIFFVNMRNWLTEERHDQRIEEVTLKVVHEDIGVLEKLNPVRTPDTNTKEILVPSDYAVVRYREWLKKWDARGWRVDMKALREKLGDVAMAIPSPARRESGNWVLDTVPLLPGDAAEAVSKPVGKRA
ncbi:MAG: aromatic ring-hydroxylating dioxygenase subunit alpha [Gammaproteobacteria bacterium]|nr:aromatic ring-hydroxylating dioxygenase subunit alpha [Gammaproteobacteria bacterium]